LRVWFDVIYPQRCNVHLQASSNGRFSTSFAETARGDRRDPPMVERHEAVSQRDRVIGWSVSGCVSERAM
jgi:hypothetical protein